MNALLNTISQRLGVPPQEIEKAYQSGEFNDVLRNMPVGLKMQVMGAINNPQALERIMQTPQAQALMRKFEENGKH
ncbi:hypothetical protein FACS1894132_08880 [Clostridia bacterium]|nr:hypothetical protein FACS1894132_08880 [Clostridia bacterium]